MIARNVGPSTLDRLADPVVVVAAVSGLIAVLGSYFATQARIDALAVQVTALEAAGQTHDAQHTKEWEGQTSINTRLSADIADENTTMKVLKADLDGFLSARERGDPLPKPRE